MFDGQTDGQTNNLIYVLAPFLNKEGERGILTPSIEAKVKHIMKLKSGRYVWFSGKTSDSSKQAKQEQLHMKTRIAVDDDQYPGT